MDFNPQKTINIHESTVIKYKVKLLNGGKGQLFLTEEIQLLNVEKRQAEKSSFGKHQVLYLKAVLSVPDKIQRWILNMESES